MSRQEPEKYVAQIKMLYKCKDKKSIQPMFHYPTESAMEVVIITANRPPIAIETARQNPETSSGFTTDVGTTWKHGNLLSLPSQQGKQIPINILYEYDIR